MDWSAQMIIPVAPGVEVALEPGCDTTDENLEKAEIEPITTMDMDTELEAGDWAVCMWGTLPGTSAIVCQILYAPDGKLVVAFPGVSCEHPRYEDLKKTMVFGRIDLPTD